MIYYSSLNDFSMIINTIVSIDDWNEKVSNGLLDCFIFLMSMNKSWSIWEISFHLVDYSISAISSSQYLLIDLGVFLFSFSLFIEFLLQLCALE